MITFSLWEVASDFVVLLLFLRSWKGDLAAVAAALLIYPFMNGMTGSAVVSPLYVISALTVMALMRAPPPLYRLPMRASPESLLVLLGIAIFVVALIELALGRTTLAGGDYYRLTRNCLFETLLPPVLLWIAARRMPIRFVIARFSSTAFLGGGALVSAAMAGWQIDPGNELGFSHGRHIIFGHDTISSGWLVLLVATCGAAWLFPMARRSKWCFPVLTLCGLGLFLIGSIQTSLAFAVLICLLVARLFAKPGLALTSLMAGAVVLMSLFTWGGTPAGDSVELATHSLGRLAHIRGEFNVDDGTTRWGQAVESFRAACARPITGNGFNSWRGGETFEMESVDRFGVYRSTAITAYPHGVIPSIMNDRGLLIGLAALVLLGVVLARAIRSVAFDPVSSVSWAASLLFIVLPLGGAWLSGLYWTTGAVWVTLALLLFARDCMKSAAVQSSRKHRIPNECPSTHRCGCARP